MSRLIFHSCFFPRSSSAAPSDDSPAGFGGGARRTGDARVPGFRRSESARRVAPLNRRRRARGRPASGDDQWRSSIHVQGEPVSRCCHRKREKNGRTETAAPTKEALSISRNSPGKKKNALRIPSDFRGLFRHFKGFYAARVSKSTGSFKNHFPINPFGKTWEHISPALMKFLEFPPKNFQYSL